MGVDETVQKVCAWEQRAPDTEPWELLSGRRRKEEEEPEIREENQQVTGAKRLRGRHR